jgi:DUF1680 family protein
MTKGKKTMQSNLRPLPRGTVKLLPSVFQHRFALNRQYMISLKTENLLQNFYLEAGLWQPRHKVDDIHGGWEVPTCQLRGHFLGHWLSAAAIIAANTGDQEIKGKADYIVSELARCQIENAGEWVGSIPEKYLDWVARGKRVWAPHYTLHKTLMGLWDMYEIGGNTQALDILLKWARWFHRWSGQFSLEKMDDIMDVETGGMLEIWANLYGLTGEQEHLELIQKYDRRRLFDPLIAGKDVLTNMHMNTTVPEVHGAARAWEVTDDPRWRQITEAYWHSGVTERGYYATGGQTNGEIWSPPNKLSERLGYRTQEHCTVYNMMRLADFLLRWNGDPAYGDYWERNLWNGILAQQHPDTGMIAYFLPLHAGAQKAWGSPTEDFWCCHGSLVQAHTIYANHIWYQSDNALTLSQYIPNEATWEQDGETVHLHLTQDHQLESHHRPENLAFELKIDAKQSREFSLRLRLPWWVNGKPQFSLNGEPLEIEKDSAGYLEIRRAWENDVLHLVFPKKLEVIPLPGESEMQAFMDGPVVLAGLNPMPGYSVAQDDDITDARVQPNYLVRGISLTGDPAEPETILIPDNEREWWFWQGSYRTHGQSENIRFIPLHEVRDEVFTVYFPISKG